MHECVTCGDEVIEDRWELDLHYCLKPECVAQNRRGLVIMEIGQTKTNAEYVILTPEKQREVAEGKFRRDPVVVRRQASSGPPVASYFTPPPKPQVNRAAVRLVQALADQGYQVNDIVAKTRHLKLTRREVVAYMNGHRL